MTDPIHDLVEDALEGLPGKLAPKIAGLPADQGEGILPDELAPVIAMLDEMLKGFTHAVDDGEPTQAPHGNSSNSTRPSSRSRSGIHRHTYHHARLGSCTAVLHSVDPRPGPELPVGQDGLGAQRLALRPISPLS